MKLLALLLSLTMLSGCASLLEREYSVVEPHSSKFWVGVEDTLRAENYQDIVNDLLILISQHTERAGLRLYGMGQEGAVAGLLNRALDEVQQETALGSYAVEYIAVSREAQRGRVDVDVLIGYRRSEAQVKALVSASSAEAVYSLLDAALEQEKEELAVRIGYWGEESLQQVEQAVLRLREDRELLERPPWTLARYPKEGPVGLLEFTLSPPEGWETPGAAQEEEAGEPPKVQLVDPAGELLLSFPLPEESQDPPSAAP